jgi:tubulin polyglutamylase TTLL6/13
MDPLLIESCKFDLRIYVYIKSLTPLKIFRFDEGLARLSTAIYEKPSKENKTNLTMHLTNYAINKWSPLFVQNKSIE